MDILLGDATVRERSRGAAARPRFLTGAPRNPRMAKGRDIPQKNGRVPAGAPHHSKALEPWYSVTRVSKKFFSLARSIVSLIHGNGFFVWY